MDVAVDDARQKRQPRRVDTLGVLGGRDRGGGSGGDDSALLVGDEHAVLDGIGRAPVQQARADEGCGTDRRGHELDLRHEGLASQPQAPRCARRANALGYPTSVLAALTRASGGTVVLG